MNIHKQVADHNGEVKRMSQFLKIKLETVSINNSCTSLYIPAPHQLKNKFKNINNNYLNILL